MVDILIGADPELFAFNKKTDQYQSVHDCLVGDKVNPFKVNLGAVQVDGTAAEFNIDAASSKNAFIRNIRTVKATIEGMIKEKNPDLILVAQPHVEYNKDYWETIPQYNKILGCDPDYNAYTGEANPRPDPEKIGKPTLRTGSGHIHIGWREPTEFKSDAEEWVHFQECCALVKLLDHFILPVEKQWDKSEVRRSLYGAPGAFRPKLYGVEYRVLSNKWVGNEEVTSWLYDTIKGIVECMRWFQTGSTSNVLKRILADGPNDFKSEFKQRLSYYTNLTPEFKEVEVEELVVPTKKKTTKKVTSTVSTTKLDTPLVKGEAKKVRRVKSLVLDTW